MNKANKKALKGSKNGGLEVKPYEINEFHRAVIDEWYVNGFNAVKAVLAVSPEDYKYATAGVMGRAIVKDKRNKAYIESKRTMSRSAVLVEQEQILQELINFAYSDITDYIGLTSEQLKELPPPVRRCLSVVNIKTVSYETETRGLVTEETMTLKLVSKERSIAMLAKHLDLFNADNNSRKPIVNFNKIDKVTINALLQAMDTPEN